MTSMLGYSTFSAHGCVHTHTQFKCKHEVCVCVCVCESLIFYGLNSADNKSLSKVVSVYIYILLHAACRLLILLRFLPLLMCHMMTVTLTDGTDVDLTML